MPTHLTSWKEYLAVGIGGMFGAVGRYSISVFVENRFLFPIETLAANLFGCFLLSFLLASKWFRRNVPPTISIGITTGVIGAFTTFSTFAVETIELGVNNFLLSFIYVCISVIGGILFCFMGYKLANKGKRTI